MFLDFLLCNGIKEWYFHVELDLTNSLEFLFQILPLQGIWKLINKEHKLTFYIQDFHKYLQVHHHRRLVFRVANSNVLIVN